MSHKVTIIGTGRMGSALAAALFQKGFATTVWNRTLSKTEPLARLGIRVAASVREAVLGADVIIVNVSDYETTTQLLQHADVESALRGKILVQLSTGTPKEAREIESWARSNEIGYLDGAIAGYPASIGTPEGTIFYSGSTELFERVKPVLLAFGDNALLVGNEIGQASAYDIAMLTFGLGAMFGFLQGYIVWEAEDLSAGGFMQFVKGMMPVLEGILTEIHERIQKREYSGAQASLEAYRPVPRDLIGWCKDRGVDHSIADAHFDLIDRAVRKGEGQSDFAYLYEILRKG
jgi:3-hydroxyisobutyrate dehydrogenase-like beta-hydroxyacid dehydrogenase